MKYSENQLKTLCKSNQKEFVRLLMSPGCDVSTLTFGAEILSEESSDEEIVIPVCRFLLKHIHAAVREGAMMAVATFYYNNKHVPSDILDKIKVMVSNDPSPNIKILAKDLLEDFAN